MVPGSARNIETLAPALDEPEYDTVRMGRISGGLWTLGGVIGAAGAMLPGASHEGMGWILGLSVVVLAYGLASVTGLIPWQRASLRTMGVGTALTIPVVGLALLLSGASISYIEPLLVCSLLYIAFFFPERWAWPLTAELLLVAGAPLLYDERATAHAFLPRYLALSAAFLAVTGVVVRVKRRLVEAERSQRELANLDPLTGIPNRRAFDCALRRELAARPPAGQWDEPGEQLVLLILDLDDFKSINDVHGHLIGDAVLRVAAGRAAGALRTGDTLARIGGDEFAVIAPGCDAAAAKSLADRLGAAVANGEPGAGVPAPRVSISWSSFPEDGESPEQLMRAADDRLLQLKRGRGGLSVVPPQELPRSGLGREGRQPSDEIAG